MPLEDDGVERFCMHFSWRMVRLDNVGLEWDLGERRIHTPQDLKVWDLWKKLLTDRAVLEAAKRAVDAMDTLIVEISGQRSLVEEIQSNGRDAKWSDVYYWTCQANK